MTITPMVDRDDWYRTQVQRALDAWMAENRTNAIASTHVQAAAAIAVDAFEDELSRQAETAMGYAVMLGCQPMLVCPTRRIARQQLKMMRRAAAGKGSWSVLKTQIAMLPQDFRRI